MRSTVIAAALMAAIFMQPTFGADKVAGTKGAPAKGVKQQHWAVKEDIDKMTDEHSCALSGPENDDDIGVSLVWSPDKRRFYFISVAGFTIGDHHLIRMRVDSNKALDIYARSFSPHYMAMDADHESYGPLIDQMLDGKILRYSVSTFLGLTEGAINLETFKQGYDKWQACVKKNT